MVHCLRAVFQNVRDIMPWFEFAFSPLAVLKLSQ